MEDDNDKTYVMIVSADGPEFFIERRIALQVDTMKAMLEGNFRESEEGVIHFPDIGGATLEKLIKYLHYKEKYSNCTTRIPEFQIDPDEALELLVAANYLNC